MKFILLTLLFLIDKLYFIKSDNEKLSAYRVGVKYKIESFSVQDAFKRKVRRIKYYLNVSADSHLFEHAFNDLNQKSCFHFGKTNDIELDTIHVRNGDYCYPDIIDENNQFIFVLYVNEKCMDFAFLQKLMLKMVIMKEDLFKLIEQSNGNTYRKNYANYANDVENEEKLDELIIGPFKRCRYDHKENRLWIFENVLKSFSNFKDYDFTLKHFQLKNGYEKATFEDFKYFNKLFCKDSCKSGSTNCANNGYPLPFNCNACMCSDLYTGSLCEKTKTYNNYYQTYIYKATNDWNNDYISFSWDRFFEFESPHGTKLNLWFIFGKRTYFPCSENPPIEIRSNNDTDGERMYACGNMKEFNIITKSNHVFLVLKRQSAAHSFKLVYQAIQQ